MKRNLFFIAAAFFILASCSKKSPNGRSVEEIQKSGIVKIAVFGDAKPFGYIDEAGKNQGYDVYFGNRIAKDLGVKAKYISVKSAARIDVLASGSVDIVLANFTATPERAEKVDFALPYMKVSLGIVSPESALITAPEQLAGKTLIITKGTTAETYFSKNHPEIKLLIFDLYSECYNALLNRLGEGFATDNTDVLAWAIENPGFSVGVEALGTLDAIAPAVQKGNENLLNWLNEEIKNLGKEKFFHAAYEETLRSVYGETVNAETFIVEGGRL